jgi:hypothetical protein
MLTGGIISFLLILMTLLIQNPDRAEKIKEIIFFPLFRLFSAKRKPTVYDSGYGKLALPAPVIASVLCEAISQRQREIASSSR